MARKTPTADQIAAREAKLEAARTRLSEGIEALTDGEQWKAMLAMAGRFHSYSWRNTLLILSQAPEATQVAGFKR